MVEIVWESWFKEGCEAEGLAITRQIWSDMQSVDGYLSHTLLVDEDSSGHLLVVSEWRDRRAADKSRAEYAGTATGLKTVPRLNPLLQRERNRWVFSVDSSAGHAHPSAA